MTEIHYGYRKRLRHWCIGIACLAGAVGLFVVLASLVMLLPLEGLFNGAHEAVKTAVWAGLAFVVLLACLASSAVAAHYIACRFCEGKGVARLYEDRVELQHERRCHSFPLEGLMVYKTVDSMSESGGTQVYGPLYPAVELRSGHRRLRICAPVGETWALFGGAKTIWKKQVGRPEGSRVDALADALLQYMAKVH